MDDRQQAQEFLKSRRARLEPEQVGLPRGRDRRVPGLRRGEAAALAGVSVEYYARLERGAIAGASTAVLEGLARALLMDDAEREHLFRLARGAQSAPRPGREPNSAPPAWRTPPALQWTLDSMENAAGLVGNGRTDLLAWNALGGELVSEMIDAAAGQRPNFARFLFLEPVARRSYPDWESTAGINVAQLHTEAGRSPHDKELHDLVGELSTRSDHFRRLWARHDVWHHDAGIKRIDHPKVGILTLHYTGLDVVGHPGVQLTVLAAEPGTADHRALTLLRLAASAPRP